MIIYVSHVIKNDYHWQLCKVTCANKIQTNMSIPRNTWLCVTCWNGPTHEACLTEEELTPVSACICRCCRNLYLRNLSRFFAFVDSYVFSIQYEVLYDCHISYTGSHWVTNSFFITRNKACFWNDVWKNQNLQKFLQISCHKQRLLDVYKK